MEILNIYKSTNDVYTFICAVSWFISIFAFIFIFILSDTWKSKVISILIPIVIFTITLLPLEHFQSEIYQVKVNDWNEVYNNNFEVVKIEGELVTLKKVKD